MRFFVKQLLMTLFNLFLLQKQNKGCLFFCTAIFLLVQINICHGFNFGDGRHGSYVLSDTMTVSDLYELVRLPTDPPEYDWANINAIPNFTDLTVSSTGVLTVDEGAGGSQGTIFLKASGQIWIQQGGLITAKGKAGFYLGPAHKLVGVVARSIWADGVVPVGEPVMP